MCGIFGIHAEAEDVANLTFFGLFALQHRGQESAGIAVGDGSRVDIHRDMGLVNQVFTPGGLAEMRGSVALGHTRYSTTGASRAENAHPVPIRHPVLGPGAIAHNGNLLNAAAIRRELEEARIRMGHQLAEEAPVDADMVIALPDSGTPAAIGYAEAAGIPFREGLVKSRYINRTFIQPTQSLREAGVMLKLNPLKRSLAGKRVIAVDDSIVRGTSSKRVIDLLRRAGATEVHMRISSSPIRFSCFLGVDIGSSKELIASNRSVPEIRAHIGADSLASLSIPGLMKA